jgi:hypothetical protein
MENNLNYLSNDLTLIATQEINKKIHHAFRDNI